MKQWVKVAVTALVVGALAMSGIALAQTSGTDDGDVTDTRAYTAILDALSDLVDDGTIDLGQAEAVAKHLAEQRQAHRPGDRGPRGPFGGSLEGLTDLLGITAEELREALGSGQSLADVAEEYGSSADAVIALILADIEAHLDQAVADGKITAEEAAERLAGAEEHVADRVNGTFERPDRPGDRGGFGRGGPGRGGPPPGAPGTGTNA